MTAPRLFEIVPFTTIQDLPEPTSGPYLVTTKTGYYIHRNFHFGRVFVPTTEAPATPEASPYLWHRINLPHELIGQAYSFFRAIYNKRKSEAMVDITWSEERGYRLFVPPQQASGGGVKATRNPEHYVGQTVGTIHSHCNFNAFHSGTDTHDAESHDGLHITIGDVLKDKPSIAIRMTVAKEHWDFEMADISDGPLKIVPHPEWWERYVSDPLPSYSVTDWKKKPVGQPTTAIAPWGKPKPITGPTKDAPMFARTYANENFGAWTLEELEYRYNDLFTKEDLEAIDRAKDLIHRAAEQLAAIGIGMDAEFEPMFDPKPVLTNYDMYDHWSES